MADYDLMEDSAGDRWLVKLTSGDFRGTVVKYNDVSFTENNADCTMHFNYDVIEADNDYSIEFLSNCTEFEMDLGDTLQILLNDSLLHYEAKKAIS